MKKKIVGILVMTLLIATAALPVVTSVNDPKDIEQVSIINKKYEYTQSLNNAPDEVLTVGDCDEFVLPTEPTYPFPDFLDWIASVYYYPDTRDCDEDIVDRFWAHTFDLEGACNNCISCIIKATLNITVWNKDGNDVLALGVIDNSGIFVGESKFLLDYGIDVGTWGTIEVEIDVTYPAVFDDMITYGRLDVYVQDDSMVDCARLEIWCCECVAPPLDMVAWWPLDEGTGIVSNDLADGNHGTWQGSPIPVAGKVAGALEFPTTDDYVLVLDDDLLDFGTGDFTIDCWVYPTTPYNGEPRTIVDKRAGTASANLGYCLFVNEDGNLAFTLGTGTGYQRFDGSNWLAVPDYTWSFVAVVVDRTYNRLELYVNNICEAPNFNFDPAQTVDNTGDLWIGKDHFISNHNFRGIIDEVELFNRALSEGELWQICFAGGACGKCKLIPYICCEGALIWTNVQPGSTVTGSFNVGNCGDTGSLLDWVICDVPIWNPGGVFDFSKEYGNDVPTTNPDQVILTVTAPSVQEQTFTGEIKICNKYYPDQFCTILVSLTTPKNKAYINTPFLNFLTSHPSLFPILQRLILRLGLQ